MSLIYYVIFSRSLVHSTVKMTFLIPCLLLIMNILCLEMTAAGNKEPPAVVVRESSSQLLPHCPPATRRPKTPHPTHWGHTPHPTSQKPCRNLPTGGSPYAYHITAPPTTNTPTGHPTTSPNSGGNFYAFYITAPPTTSDPTGHPTASPNVGGNPFSLP